MDLLVGPEEGDYIDRVTEAGYRRRPPEEPDELLQQMAVASIEAEPW